MYLTYHCYNAASKLAEMVIIIVKVLLTSANFVQQMIGQLAL